MHPVIVIIKTRDSKDPISFSFPQNQMSQWRKGTETGNKKPKYKYKTIDELRKSGATASNKRLGGGSPSRTADSSNEPLAPSSLSNVKVIDLTGKEKKVFSG